MKLSVVVHAAPEGGFWAEVPALKGCFTQGETIAELEENVKEAIEGWLEVASEYIPDTTSDPVYQLLEVVV